MISQMNVVQNAARLAMDHRAARPRQTSPAASRLSAWLVVSGAAIVAVLFGIAYFFTV